MSSAEPNPAKVLIAENEFLLAAALENLVLGAGHQVIGLAADEAEALSIVEREPPTLAIIDLQLARGSDGARLAQVLQQRFRLPIIIVTGYPPDVIERACRAVQPCAVIRKPFSDAEIVGAISDCLCSPGEAREAGGAEA